MKQRIAFIICGQPRFISLYQEYMSKLSFEFDHEIDFFFHFWGNQNNEIVDILQPKKYLFEPQIDFTDYIKTFNRTDKTICNYRPIDNFVSYSYSTKRAFELKDEYELENKFEYDLVFRVRFDIFLLNTLIFKKEKLDFYKKSFNASDHVRFFPLLHHQKIFGMGDLLNFSNSKTMKFFNNIYENIQDSFNHESVNNYILQSRHKWYCGESWMAYSFYKYLSKTRPVSPNINIFKMPYLLKRITNDNPNNVYYKITQDFQFDFRNHYPQSTIV